MDAKERVMAGGIRQGAGQAAGFLRQDRPTLITGLQVFGMHTEAELRESWGLDCQKTKYNDIYYTESGRSVWGSEENWDAGYNSAKEYPPGGSGERGGR